MSLCDQYLSASAFDEMVDQKQRCKPHWQSVYDRIEAVGVEGLQAKQSEIDWSLEENGVTYNVYDAPDGINKRRWTLDPIPFVVAQSEWDVVVKGLRQRAKLFNLILRDLYGDRHLIRQGILPAEAVFSHKGFSPEVYNFATKKNFELFFYAADIARGPDGKFWVVKDRVQAPSGLGYAVENRLSMNSVANTLYPDVKTRRLVRFMEEFKGMIARLGEGENSLAALLTPGPHNETYFEHAYLSSLLDIALVQGEDLLAKDGALWIKNLGGLSKVSTLLRRLDDRYCDPLELKNDSQLGVAGLVDTMRRGNLAMINPVGAAALENPALVPFMKNIAQFFLDEELLMPQIATWWCGQPRELEYVLENISTLIVKNINRSTISEAYFGKQLDAAQKDALRAQIIASPHLYVAQEEIGFSTVPYFTGKTIEPRNASIRAFSFKQGSNYWVMNGGLVRVSTQKDALFVSSQQGGTSKDLWIVGDEEEVFPTNPFGQNPCADTSLDEIPTRRAENLYWLGRYLSRSITVTRLVRFVLKRLISSNRDERQQATATQEQLLRTITHLTMTYPGFLDEKEGAKRLEKPFKEIVSILTDGSRTGSLTFTLSMLATANTSIRNMFNMEAWRLFEKMQVDWLGFCRLKNQSHRGAIQELDKLHVNLLAYKALVEESIFKEQGLVLYDIGFRTESSLAQIAKARALLCVKQEKGVEYELLESLLRTSESFNAYRALYKSSLQLESIIEFIFLNPQYPKSLTYKMQRLLDDFKSLPKLKQDLTDYEAPIFQSYSTLRLSTAAALVQSQPEDGVYNVLDSFLSELSELILRSSDEFTKTYFSHYDE